MGNDECVRHEEVMAKYGWLPRPLLFAGAGEMRPFWPRVLLGSYIGTAGWYLDLVD